MIFVNHIKYIIIILHICLFLNKNLTKNLKKRREIFLLNFCFIFLSFPKYQDIDRDSFKPIFVSLKYFCRL